MSPIVRWLFAWSAALAVSLLAFPVSAAQGPQSGLWCTYTGAVAPGHHLPTPGFLARGSRVAVITDVFRDNSGLDMVGIGASEGDRAFHVWRGALLDDCARPPIPPEGAECTYVYRQALRNPEYPNGTRVVVTKAFPVPSDRYNRVYVAKDSGEYFGGTGHHVSASSLVDCTPGIGMQRIRAELDRQHDAQGALVANSSMCFPPNHFGIDLGMIRHNPATPCPVVREVCSDPRARQFLRVVCTAPTGELVPQAYIVNRSDPRNVRAVPHPPWEAQRHAAARTQSCRPAGNPVDHSAISYAHSLQCYGKQVCAEPASGNFVRIPCGPHDVVLEREKPGYLVVPPVPSAAR